MAQNSIPVVSIITVCYFSEATIEATIQSVLSQDYPLIEYIIVDGNSKDDTLKIVQKYDGRIAKWISEPDKGIYDAMNKGITLATGEIVGILNSDDIFASSTMISEIVKVFIDKKVDLLYGNINYFKNDLQRTVRTWVTKPYYDNFFDDGEVPPHPSLFVRKSVYEQIGMYYPDFKISSDYEFMFRALKINSYKSFHLNQFIVNMRIGGQSTRSFKNNIISNREIITAWKMNNVKPPLRFWFLRILKKIRQFKKAKPLI